MKNSILSLLLALFIASAAGAQVVAENQVPANVKAVAVEKNKGKKIDAWVLDKGENKYVASVISDAEMRMIKVSAAGKWLGTTEGVLPEKMPTAVMAAAKKRFAGFEFDNYFYVTEPGKAPYYSVDASSDDESLTLTFDAAGKLLSKEAQ